MSRTLRTRHDALQRTVDRSGGPEPHGSSAMLARTFQEGTYPTSAASTFACKPVSINGDETEGTLPTYVVDSDVTLYAVNLGTTIPPVTSYVILSGVGGRWTFRYDG